MIFPSIAEEYLHLRAAVRRAMLLSDAERCHLIREGCWILYPRAADFLERITELMNWPRMGRMPSIALCGAAGNGKSRIIARALEILPKPFDLDDVTIWPVVMVQMPPGPGLAGVYKAILRELGVPFPMSARIDFIEARCVDALKKCKTKLLVIDEVHHVLTAAPLAQRQVLAQLKYLSNELEMSLVAVGTEVAWNALKTDPQLASRFDPFSLPIWTEGKQLLQLLSSFAMLIPLRNPSDLATVDMARRILRLTDGTIGEISKLLKAAAVAAIQTGTERITVEMLMQAKHISPEQKRQETEALVE